MKCFKLSVECATKEVAVSIQKWINKNYYQDEVYWNVVTELKPKDLEEKK